MSIFRLLQRGTKRANYFLFMSGGIFVFFTVFATVGDVTGRYFFSKPILGVFELAGLACLCLVCTSLAHTQAMQGHVAVDLLYNRLPARAQAVTSVIISGFGLLMAALLIAGAIPYALDSKASAEFSGTLNIPLYPFKFLMILGALALFGQLVLDFVSGCRRVGGHHRGNIA